MNFKSVEKIAEVIQFMKDADEPRQQNRARINGVFNGDPPYTEEEAQEGKVQINTSWGDGPSIMDNARGQWEQAMTSKDRYFTVRLRAGPAHLRVQRSQKITMSLAKLMKANQAYTDTVNCEGAQTMLHGIGPSMWEDQWKWYPYSVALEDLKVPSRTLTSFANMDHFAVLRRYTPSELYTATFGPYASPRWKAGPIKKLLAAVADVNVQQTDWDTYQFPERLEEDFKSNAGYWGSDAVPTINCWDFYFKDEPLKNPKTSDQKTGWQRRIILDWNQPTLGSEGAATDFLYEGTEPYAEKLSHFFHVVFANGCHVAPFRYHSVRGLGYRLYGPCRIQNRIRCRFAETAFEEMMWIFHNVAAEDRERLEMMYLNHMGVLPEGVKWVPANERYRPQLDIILGAMNQNRQLMSESSASYVQDVENSSGSDQETATKTMTRLQASNQLIGAFLSKAYGQQKHQYIEICRRFCLDNSPDPDVQTFRSDMARAEIPDEFLNVDMWEVTPEKTLGNGNNFLAVNMVDRLMSQYNRFDGQGQREVLNLFTEISTDDPDFANSIVPVAQQDASPAMIDASRAMGTLMLGLPVPERRGLDPKEYAETLLRYLGLIDAGIQQSGGMTDEKTLKGMFAVANEVEQNIKQIAQDPSEKQIVKQLEDALKNLVNNMKGYAQRLAEQAQKRGGQLDPELMAKIQGTVLIAKTKAQIMQATAQQKMAHKERSFWSEQRRKDFAAGIDGRRKLQDAQVDAAAKDITTAADIRNGARRSMAAFDEGGGE